MKIKRRSVSIDSCLVKLSNETIESIVDLVNR